MTGASRGIGRAIAERLAAGGATVVCVARGDQRGCRPRRRSRRRAARRLRIGADVTDAAAVEGLIKSVVDKHGKLDILVSNAGITRDQLMLRMKRSRLG